MLLRITPVFSAPSASFVGETRVSEMPLGLHTMFSAALSAMDECGIKPHAIHFGNEEDCRLRAQDAILELHNGNALAHECFPRQPIDTWASFLELYSWSLSKRCIPDGAPLGVHFTKCLDCQKNMQGDQYFTTCSNPDCPSHAKWAAVNGTATP